jgi:apolipoprotein N-acyltransferase
MILKKYKSINFYLNCLRWRHRELVLLLASAFSYVVFSTSSWWYLGFCWPILLWMAFKVPRQCLVLGVKSKVLGAFIWSAIAIGGQFLGLGKGLRFFVRGSWCTRLIVPCIMVGYHITVCALWLWCTDIIISYYGLCTKPLYYGVWAVSLWLYCIFLNDFSLTLCGAVEGCGLYCPLVPFVDIPALLWPLPHLGEYICLGLFFLLQVLAVQRRIGLTILLVGMWLGGARWGDQDCADALSWAHSIAVVRSQFFECDISRARKHVMVHVHDIERAVPGCLCVIFPESSVYVKDFLPAMGTRSLFKGQGLMNLVSVVVGGFRTERSCVYNTLWLVQQGRVAGCFDKQHILPFTEYLPWWAAYCGLQRLFFDNTRDFVITRAPTSLRPRWELLPGVFVVPYICSELFLQHRPCVNPSDIILAVCNNSWAPQNVRWLMARVALYKAIAWQRSIIYVAHDYSAVMTPHGMRYALYEEQNPCGRLLDEEGA